MDPQFNPDGLNDDAFAMALDHQLTTLQELPDSFAKELVKNEYPIKSEMIKMDQAGSSEPATMVKKPIDSNTEGLIKLMDQLDPVLSWELLGQKILSKYSMFEDALERAR